MGTETLEKRFKPMLRYGQAVELCGVLGVTESVFKDLLQGGQIEKRVLKPGTRAYYYRDQILSVLGVGRAVFGETHDETTNETER